MFDFGESVFAPEFNFLADSHILAVDHWSSDVREPVAVPDSHAFEDYSQTDTANFDPAARQQLLTSTSTDAFLFPSAFEAQTTNGGDDEGDIVVIGKRPPLPDYDGGGLGGGSTGGDGGGSTGGGGGSGGTSNTDFTISNDDSSCEDGAAIKAADTIDDLSDSQGDYEYSGVLVRNSDGTYGLANNEMSTLYSTTSSTFDSLSDASSVYGVIHNHTFNSSDYNSNSLQRYPSSSDWYALDSLVANGANPNNLSLFLVDPFGTMREFNYSDKAMYENMTDQQRYDGDSLPEEATAC